MELWAILEAVGVAFGIAYAVLAIRENAWCRPAGMVSVAIYAAVFGHARIYGAAGLQVLYLAFSVYGWHAWRHGGPLVDESAFRRQFGGGSPRLQERQTAWRAFAAERRLPLVFAHLDQPDEAARAALLAAVDATPA